MTQITKGWRRMLSFPCIYKMCMNMLRNSQARPHFVASFIRPYSEMHILDIGCGPATILNLLPEDVRYVGVDTSRKYIDEARRLHKERGVFLCMDVEKISHEDLGKFDLVMGLGVVHHLDDKQGSRFFTLAAKALNEKGRCLTLDPCHISGQHFLARWLIALDRGQNVRNVEEYQALVRKSFNRVISTLRHDLLRVPYTHLIMECSN